MKQNKAYRPVEPEDFSVLLMSIGEIGAVALSAALTLGLVWFIGGPI
jgi:hypothetical protein